MICVAAVSAVAVPMIVVVASSFIIATAIMITYIGTMIASIAVHCSIGTMIASIGTMIIAAAMPLPAFFWAVAVLGVSSSAPRTTFRRIGWRDGHAGNHAHAGSWKGHRHFLRDGTAKMRGLELKKQHATDELPLIA